MLALAALLCVAIAAWGFLGVFTGERPRGDGTDPTTYGYDLSTLRIDGHAFVAGGNVRGFLAPLDKPAILDAADVAATNAKERTKHVVGGDRVIGVVIDGEARAYPLPIMNAHEVCNDTLGGVPIAVTYGPLCDSVVVFDRRIGDGAAAHVARFAASGLLLDSNLVMEDLHEPGTEVDGARSLWSQLGARAISGIAAKNDLTLRMVPGVQLVTWSQWRARHPTTTVVRRDPGSIRRMKQFDYSRYWASGKPLFPVHGKSGALAPSTAPAMMPVTAVTLGGETRGYRLDQLFQWQQGAGEVDRVATRLLGGAELRFELEHATETVWVDAPADAVILHMRWFAWSAFFESATEPGAGSGQ